MISCMSRLVLSGVLSWFEEDVGIAGTLFICAACGLGGL